MRLFEETPVKKLLGVIALVPVLAISQSDSRMPFSPVHAYEQPVLISRAIQEEFDQFRAFEQAITLETQVEMAQRKFEQAKTELERNKTLLNSGVVSETQ